MIWLAGKGLAQNIDGSFYLTQLNVQSSERICAIEVARPNSMKSAAIFEGLHAVRPRNRSREAEQHEVPRKWRRTLRNALAKTGCARERQPGKPHRRSIKESLPHPWVSARYL